VTAAKTMVLSIHAKLAPELLLLIASFLSPADLAVLARVSSIFLQVSRSQLYEQLRVQTEDLDAIKATMLFLRTAGNLPQKIKHLQIVGIRRGSNLPAEDLEPDPPLSILPLTTNLRSIHLFSSSLFGIPGYTERFVSALNTSCPTLKELKLGAHFTCADGELLISGLETIRWFGGYGAVAFPFFTLYFTDKLNVLRRSLF